MKCKTSVLSIVWVLGALAMGWNTALGQCALPSANLINNNYSSVTLAMGSGAGPLASHILAGGEQWNNALCKSSYSVSPYPHFMPYYASGIPVITIEVMPEGIHSPYRGCGEFTGSANGMTGTIRIYREKPDGQSCGLGDSERVSDLIAHELGHYLNLANSNCTDGIMGPPTRSWDGSYTNKRQILFSECSLADWLSITPEEQDQEAEAEMDPYDPAPEPCVTCGSSPILLDLDRNNFHLLMNVVYFDIDADGKKELISWTDPDQGDAFLCLDRNANGVIDDGGELFGDSTRMTAGHPAQHGYIALAELDESPGGNFDGIISELDARFEDLCLWIDSNFDGVSDPDELRGLRDEGVLEIDLQARAHRRVDQSGNEFRYLGQARMVDDKGRIRTIATTDVFFTIFED